MNTFLDLLVVAAVGLAAAGVLVLALMFLVPNERVRRVCLYAAAGLGAYLGYVGWRINALGTSGGGLLALVLALVGLGALVLERLWRQDPARQLIPRLAAAVSVLGGLANAFL